MGHYHQVGILRFDVDDFKPTKQFTRTKIYGVAN
jgi:hypothetical protein